MDIHRQVIEKIKTVYDPELPVDVYSLGLIYTIKVDEEAKKVDILMTLTTPNCPAAGIIPEEIRDAVLQVQGIEKVEIKITFEPPYHINRMSEEAKATLGWV